jgi:hypothetical protein
MATINSPVTRFVDCALGYLGLFLIGLIGWICDRLPAGPARHQHRLPPGECGHAAGWKE